MFKKVALLGMLISATGALAAPLPAPVLVAWDIHQVLCSKPDGQGYKCTPNEDTFKLVEALHRAGVRQVIFSNISNRSYERLSELYPKHFSYFDKTGSLANSHGIFTRKPHSKYFAKFVKLNPDIDRRYILFFDDKPENIKGARAFGIDGQLFCSPEQARSILINKGLL